MLTKRLLDYNKQKKERDYFLFQIRKKKMKSEVGMQENCSSLLLVFIVTSPII